MDGWMLGLWLLRGLCSYRAVPFFWTQQFGKSIRYAGHAERFETLVHGSMDVEKPSFTVFYCNGDEVGGVWLCALVTCDMLASWRVA
jgi:hypothetical protein